MRVLTTIVVLIAILTSCKDTKQKAITKSQIDLSRKFKPLLHGVWVPSDYVAELTRTKSPRKASDYLNRISEFVIDTSGTPKDSLEVGISLGNHEGSQFVLYFKQGQSSNALLTNVRDFDNQNGTYELGIAKSVVDTFLVLYHYDKNKRLIDQTKYLRVKERQPASSLEDGFQYIVNKKLVAGTYKTIDSTGKEFFVSLGNDGTMSGFPNRKTYYILTDFVAEEEGGADEMCFDIQTTDQDCYGFKIKGDTVNLFKLQEKRNAIVETDSVIYTLIKVK